MKTKPDRNNKIKKMNYLFLLWLIPLILFIVFGIPLLINFILFQSWPPTPSDLTNKEWLGFWASFIGSIIGGIATYIAVLLTLNNNNEINEKNRDFQESQKKEEQRIQDEIRTRDVYPVFELVDYPIEELRATKLNNNGNVWLLRILKDDFRLDCLRMWYQDYQYYENRNLTSTLKFTNIGMALAIGVKVHVKNVDNSSLIDEKNRKHKYKTLRMEIGIPNNQPRAILLVVEENDLSINEECSITFFYKNIYKKTYEQKAIFYIMENGKDLFVRMDSPDPISDDDYKYFNEWDE